MFSKKAGMLLRRALAAAIICVLASAPAVTARAEETDSSPAVESGAEAESVTPTPEPTPPPAEVMPTNGIEGWPKSLDTDGDYICLMDADTGAILLEKSMDVSTPPASLTKIMTCLVALENADDLNAQITMDETGVAYAVSGSSSLYTQVGEVFTLKDALYGVMLKSANDLATQVGKYIGGGDLETFIKMMNEKAEKLGCTGTHFVNACGMPAEGHVSTAHDMALIFREALKNETFREIIHTNIYTIPATNLTEERIFQNHQPFISNSEWNTYEGILGGKTGYTDLAGSCLITGCEQNGMTLIAVTMHCDSSYGFEADTKQMLDFGFGNFRHGDVGSSDEGLISGGYVTIPNDASESDCTWEDSEITLEDGRTETERTYSWHGRAVGTSFYESSESKAASAQAETASGSSSGAASGSDADSGVSGSGANSAADVSGANPETGRTGDAALTSSDGENVTVMGITMNRTGFLAVSVLIVLVLVALILLIITMLLRSARKNHRRR